MPSTLERVSKEESRVTEAVAEELVAAIVHAIDSIVILDWAIAILPLHVPPDDEVISMVPPFFQDLIEFKEIWVVVPPLEFLGILHKRERFAGSSEALIDSKQLPIVLTWLVQIIDLAASNLTLFKVIVLSPF